MGGIAEKETRPGWLPPRPADVGATPEPAPATATQRPAYRDDGEYRAVERPPSSPLARVGIVLSITALVLVVLTAGVGFHFGVVLSVVALLCARTAKRRAQEGQPAPPRQLRLSWRLAIAALVVSLIAMVTWLVLTANGITQEDYLEWLQREQDRLWPR